MGALDGYLVRPKGTIYHVRIQYSPFWQERKGGRKVFQQTLRTDNRALAEIRAAPHVVMHKYEVYAERLMRSRDIVLGRDEPSFMPGATWTHNGKLYRAKRDGSTVQVYDAATEEYESEFSNKKIPRLLCPVPEAELSSIESIKALLGPMWNRGLVPGDYDPAFASEITSYVTGHVQFLAADKLPKWPRQGNAPPPISTDELTRLTDYLYEPQPVPGRRKPNDDKDKVLFAHWIKERGVSQRNQGAAKLVYEDFRDLTGKTLHTATRDDAKKLVELYKSRDLMWSAYSKKVRWLSIVIDAAKDETFAMPANPFRGIAPKPPRQISGVKVVASGERKAYNDQDMAKIMSFLPKLTAEMQMLVMLVACTGMRPSEAIGINLIEIDGWYWCVTVGTKTLASRRTIPLPEIVHPYIETVHPEIRTNPDRQLFTKAPLHNQDEFERYTNKMLSVLNRAFKRNGMEPFKTSRKSFYSLRHRAKQKMRNAMVNRELQQWALGHKRVNSEDEYGDAPPVNVIQDAMKVIWQDIPRNEA